MLIYSYYVIVQVVNPCKDKALIEAIKLILRYNQTLSDKFVPNIWTGYGERMTGGCRGYAANFMRWPEQLIIGGVRHSPTGTIEKYSIHNYQRNVLSRSYIKR